MDKISERLGALMPVEHIERKASEISAEIKEMNNDIQKNSLDDYSLVRSNMKELIDSSMNLVPSLVSVVREAESARMYESASGFIKMIAELNVSLIEINKKMEKGKTEDQRITKEVTNNNTVFIGTGDDIFKKISRRNQSSEVIEGEP